MKTVIAGGVAAGASAGARLRRLDESAEIVVLERDHYVSFANCGLPYHIGGAIPAPPRFTACAHLILQMLNSNPVLFIRGDNAEEAWRIIDPVINAWSAGDVPMQEYPAGQEDHAVGAPEGTIPGPAR
jgi:hypothetical protein